MRRVLTALALLWAAGVFGYWVVLALRGAETPLWEYYRTGLRYTLVVGAALLAHGAIALALFRVRVELSILYVAATGAGVVAYSVSLWAPDPQFAPPVVSLLIGTLVVVAAAGIGRLLLRSAVDAFGGPLWRLAVWTALGLGVYALGFLSLGLAGLLRPAAAWIALAAGLAAAAAIPWRALAPLPERARAALTPLRIALLAPLAPTLIYLAIRTAAPAVDHDSMQYHLAQPQTQIDAGAIRFDPGNDATALPANAEMLSLFGMLLRDDVAARTVHAWTFVLMLVALYRMARRHADTDAALLAVSMFGALALWRVPLGTAMSETILVFFAVLAADLLLDARAWPLAAVFGGLAAGTKITGWIVPASLGVAALVVAWRSPRRFLAFGALSLLVALPWYARAYAWTGNPVWPLAYEIFGGDDWNAKMASRYNAALEEEPVAPARIPWDATFNGRRFESSVEPFLLGLIPLALLRPTRAAGTWLLASAVGAAILAPLLFFPRYLLPLLPGACAAVAAGPRSLRVLAVGAVWLLAASRHFPAVEDAPAVAAGFEPREAYLERHLPRHALDRWANAHLPAGARVFITGHAPGYYLRRPYLWGCQAHQARIDYDGMDAAALRSALAARGVTHLLLDGKVLPIEREMADRFGRRLFGDGEPSLYELRLEGGP